MTNFNPGDGCLVSAVLRNLFSYYVANFCNCLKILYQIEPIAVVQKNLEFFSYLKVIVFYALSAGLLSE